MRIIGLLISLVLIVGLFYTYINSSLVLNEDLDIQEGDTIIDTIDYTKEATSQAELETCLRLCNIDLDRLEVCQRECNIK